MGANFSRPTVSQNHVSAHCHLSVTRDTSIFCVKVSKLKETERVSKHALGWRQRSHLPLLLVKGLGGLLHHALSDSPSHLNEIKTETRRSRDPWHLDLTDAFCWIWSTITSHIFRRKGRPWSRLCIGPSIVMRTPESVDSQVSSFCQCLNGLLKFALDQGDGVGRFPFLGDDIKRGGHWHDLYGVLGGQRNAEASSRCQIGMRK